MTPPQDVQLDSYKSVFVEEAALTATNILTKEALIEEAVAAAVQACGSNMEVTDVVIVSQTGQFLWDANELIGDVTQALSARGITVRGTISLKRAFSNSQPIFADAANKIEQQGGRTLMLAIEPLNLLNKNERSTLIGRGVLDKVGRNEVKSMLQGLEGLTAAFVKRFGIDEREFRDALEKLAIYLHDKKTSNLNAQKRGAISKDNYNDATKNPAVGELLHLLDCCPTTTRAAAVILSHSDELDASQKNVRMLVHASVDDTRIDKRRKEFQFHPNAEALYKAMALALDAPTVKEAGITRDKILSEGVLELHNAVSPLILMALIELGYLKMGRSSNNILVQLDRIMESSGGRINPSGGLLAGHPLAATYPSILYFTLQQMRGLGGGMQVDGEVLCALIQSIWGLRDKMSVTILEKV